MSFSERLKQLRKGNGYTQVELADALGVSSGTVAMWETGKRTPDYETLYKLSQMFDRRIDYILGYSDDAASPKAVGKQVAQTIEWITQNKQIDVFRQYLRLDAYAQATIKSLINSESIRCKEQGTENDITNIRVGICMLDQPNAKTGSKRKRS